jgi:hypothetical protein
MEKQPREYPVYSIYHRISPMIRTSPHQVYRAYSREDALRALDITMQDLNALCEDGFIHYYQESARFCALIGTMKPFCIELGPVDAISVNSYSDCGPNL